MLTLEFVMQLKNDDGENADGTQSMFVLTIGYVDMTTHSLTKYYLMVLFWWYNVYIYL